MWVILYLAGLIVLLLAVQSVVLRAFKEPLQWTYGASSKQPKSLQLTLKLILQFTLISSILLFPLFVGSTPGRYYGPLFPGSRWVYFLYGEGIAVTLFTVILLIEVACGWIEWTVRWPAKKAFTKSALSALSSLTVVVVEEPFFRGVLLQYLLYGAAPAAAAALRFSPWLAIPLSAILFSAAHFLRKTPTYWPFVGLAVLGLWLGVAYYKTHSLWLPMGIHSGGILCIGIHRCFTRYNGSPYIVGTQTFPIAGLIAIGVMLVWTALTWFLF